MAREVTIFTHKLRGPGRPQVVLFGNGLERHQSWSELVEAMAAEHSAELTGAERSALPFPLLYELISVPSPAPSTLSRAELTAQDRRLAEQVARLVPARNAWLDRLPTLGADHIFTTNYSYSLEASFFPSHDFSKTLVRHYRRFTTTGRSERSYRMHSGYLGQNADGTPVGLWHIHGESGAPSTIVLGHDRYGRLLSRMEALCSAQVFKAAEERQFTSWPELFLYADVYIVGLGFWPCEHDLWWLLRRKQREQYADGRVWFYAPPHEQTPEHRLRDKLLLAHGVTLAVPEAPADYTTFYHRALDDITQKIASHR